MQEDINQKTIAIAIKTTKVTARVLRDVLRALLRHWRAQRQKSAHAAGKDEVVNHGKKTLKQLQAQGHELTSIEITDDNIKSFEHCARKYGIDFSLKKDRTANPPQYYVFFKARDTKVMEAAFREYTAQVTKTRPSVRKRLQEMKKRVVPHRERVKQRDKHRSESL